MNVQPSYTLASPPQTEPGPARLGAAVARHVFHRDLPDRRRRHRRDVVHHRHCLLSRRLRRRRQRLLLWPGRRVGGKYFRHVQPVPRRIPAAELLRLQAARPPHHPIVERDADLPAYARLHGADHGRLFARLDRAVLFRHARRPDRAALCDRAHHGDGAGRGPDFGATHLPDRNRRAYRRFRAALRAVDARPQYRRLPLSHAGRIHRVRGNPARGARSRPRRSGRQRARARARRDLSVAAVVGDRNHRPLRRDLPGAAGRDPPWPRADPA